MSFPGGPALEIPPGALSGNTRITIQQAVGAAPAGAVTAVYTFGPAGTTFTTPVKVSFPVPAGTGAADVSVYWTEPGSTDRWHALPATISGTTATAEITHFSSGFVGAHCTAGGACLPGNPCHTGVTTCNGTPSCEDTGANAIDGTVCSEGLVCSAGACASPDYLAIATARVYLVTTPAGATYGILDQVDQYALPNWTRRVVSSNATTAQVRSFTLQDGTVGLSAIATYDSNGAQTSSTTYAPPLLIFPAVTTPGTTASRTSTATSATGTYAQVRSLTVDGLESVTVPAGTFQALRITTIVNPSSASASTVVQWFAPGVGKVKELNYAAATPSAATTHELVARSRMACDGGACACNALVNSAPEVAPVYVPADLPVPAGGELSDGTYHVTANSIYTGPGGGSGPTGASIRNTFDFRTGVLQGVTWYVGRGERRFTAAFSASGTWLSLAPLCGEVEEGNFGFTASGGELRIIAANPFYPASSTDQGAVTTLTRQ